MISKNNRYKGQGGIKYLFSKGQTIRGNYITTRFLNNRRQDYRAAVVVSKKVTKSAPKRNRIRRRIYEIIRLNAPKYLTNQDIAIIVFSEKLATIPHDELSELIIDHLKQISKISKK